MSLNTAHANNGVLIHAGEYDSVTLNFSGQDSGVFSGSKQGRIYLTSHRMIFNNKKPDDPLQSFSAPFIAMSDVDIEQPVFSANYIKGKVRAQPNGNFVGEVKFKLHFKAGGAIEYGQALLRAAKTAQSNMRNGNFSDDPPPYTPSGAWHEAPPPAYQPPPGYYGWLPMHDAFSGPPPNTVFMSDNPPPYPGIGGPPPYTPAAPQPGYNPYQPTGPGQQQPGYNPYQPTGPGQQQPGYNPYQPTGPGQQQPGYNPHQPTGPGQQQPGYNPHQPTGPGQQNESVSWNGFSLPPENNQPSTGGGHQPPPQQWGGAPPSQQQWGGFQPPPYGAPGPQGYPGGAQQPQGGYPYPAAGAAGGAAAGAMGFSAPPANSKEAEALASANNTVYNQRSDNAGGGGLPPSYNDLPPSYNEWNRKNQ